MTISDKEIVVISNEPWGEIWYSKQNYAFELARTNRVLFVNPCSKWKFSNLFRMRTEFKIVHPNLTVLTYTNLLPSLNKGLFLLNNFLISKKLKFALKKRGIEAFLFWNFDPHRLCTPAAMGAGLSVYHCVDKYDLRHYGEKYLCRNSDHIFIVSEEFRETYSKLNPSVSLLTHGISSDEFTRDDSPSTAAKDAILYVGNIDSRLDFELIEKALIQFPEERFVFVGKENLDPTNLFSKRIFTEKKYPNLITTGPIHFKKLKNYIADSKCCIAFMSKEYNGNQISHHKIFLYLAHGKPVFSCVFTEYVSIRELLYMNDDNRMTLTSLQQFLQEGEADSLKEKRIIHASSHRFQAILERAGDLLYKHS